MQYIKHPFEQNKLIKQLTAIENQWQSKQRVYKNCIRASRKALKHQRELNASIESLYHTAVIKIKQLFSKLPDKEKRILVEINLKAHPMNVEDLHSILLSTFFFDLQCNVQNKYWISYKFYNCPIEAEIRDLLHRLSLTRYCTADSNIQDYKTYFNKVLQVQPERFISVL